VASAKLNDYREVLTSGEPLLINGTVDAPFGEGESTRERLRFHGRQAAGFHPRRAQQR